MKRSDIENKAYDILLKYMQSKAKMQVRMICQHCVASMNCFFKDYLKEHNRCYIDLYLETQQDYIVQMERELSLNQSVLEQMENVAI